nr:ribbon-helix-helix protein, CopG family [Sphingobium yanoikuyae]
MIDMARISLRLDDELHDHLLVHALRSGVSLSELVRSALKRSVRANGAYRPAPQELQVALLAGMFSMVRADIQARAPELIGSIATSNQERLERWGIPDEVGAVISAEMEAAHGC